MENTTLATMLHNTYTRKDFYRRIDAVQEFLEHEIYGIQGLDSAEGKLATQAAAYVRQSGVPDLAPHIEAWGDEVVAELMEGNLYDRVREFKDAFDTLPELVLYTPVEVDDANMAEIGAWCRENVNGKVVIRNVTDPDAVGGCAIAWNDAYHDLTLRYFMKKRRAEVSELIRTYDAS